MESMSLEPDILLPDQLGGLTAARKPLQGARLLMLAVLQDAIKSSGAPDMAKFEQGVKDAWEQEGSS